MMSFPARFHIPTSVDGKPLAVEIRDFFPSHSFPYDRLPRENSIIAALMRPDVCINLCVLYILSKPALNNVATKVKTTSTLFISFVAIHNLALAIFSAVVAVNSWPIVIVHYQEKGFQSIYCDRDGTFWNDSGFGGWANIFYFSKYYEFIDTWILILKGKKPSFLQVYHHIGIAIFMWSGVVSQSAWLSTVVLLNSVIHTLMYTYFFIKTLYPKMEIPSAKYLTKAQISQFMLGIIYSSGLHYLGTDCATPAQLFSALCIQLYAVGLITLFVAFATKKYKKKLV